MYGYGYQAKQRFIVCVARHRGTRHTPQGNSLWIQGVRNLILTLPLIFLLVQLERELSLEIITYMLCIASIVVLILGITATVKLG